VRSPFDPPETERHPVLRVQSYLVTALLLISAGAAAQQSESASADEARSASAPYEPKVWAREMSGSFGGEQVDYTATAGETVLYDDEGKPKASIFSIAYVREGVDDAAARPVTFLFNGGPGSASLWLHMGAFGPKRVVLPSDARDDGAPPYTLVDNPEAPLDVTDVVFIDPVGTGFSRPLGDHDAEEFYGLTEDAAAVGDFIRRWLSENGRWNSPKYVGGESYGTTRTAMVLRELEGRFNDVAFNGAILISTILDFSARVPSPGNEMSTVVYLPTYAATAWYHGKVEGEEELEPFLEEAREFARTDYITALLQGNRLGDAERARIRSELARFTGLSETYLEQTNLRIEPQRFYKELLRDRGLTVGRLDSRYTGVDYDAAGERPDMDPSFYGIDASYTATVNHYLRDVLGVDFKRQYSTIGGLGGEWNWELPGQRRQAYLNVGQFIGRAMRENSELRVFNAAGYYDFATPFFGAEYALTRNGVVPERVTFEYYEAGHMMYVHEPSLQKLAADIRAFIAGGGR